MTTNPEGLREALEAIANYEGDPRTPVHTNAKMRGIARAALAASINPVAVDSTVIGGAAAAGRDGEVECDCIARNALHEKQCATVRARASTPEGETR